MTDLVGVCANGRTKCEDGVPTCVPNFLPGDQTELCNGLDDDCNELIDDTEVALACYEQLPNAKNVAAWACDLGNCTIGRCVDGTDDLDGNKANGCECTSDAQPAACDMNATTAVNKGQTIAVSGVVQDIGGGDWITFDFQVSPVGQPYHPKIELTNNAGGLYAMDVLVDCAGTAAGCSTSGGANNETGQNATVWEQNYNGYLGGTACCSDPTPRADVINVLVRRTSGAVPACEERYTVTATNP